jgi:hypothetical protein
VEPEKPSEDAKATEEEAKCLAEEEKKKDELAAQAKEASPVPHLPRPHHLLTRRKKRKLRRRLTRGTPSIKSSANPYHSLRRTI